MPILPKDLGAAAACDPSHPIGPEELAAASSAVLDLLGIVRADIVGNSVGGIVAQILASYRPSLVRKLVLIGTSARTAGTLPAFKAQVDAWVEAGNVTSARSSALAGWLGQLEAIT